MIGQSVKRNQRLVIQEVKTLREPVRLAEGVQGGALDEMALDRGWQALARFGKKLRGFEAGRVRAVATSAVREAANAHLFLASAERHLGFRIDVISGHEEARLVYAGVAHTIPCVESTRLVVYIGGGSTEFFWLKLKQPLDTRTLLKAALAADVAFMPGEPFFPEPDKNLGHLRLNFSHIDPARLDEGLKRLAVVVSYAQAAHAA